MSMIVGAENVPKRSLKKGAIMNDQRHTHIQGECIGKCGKHSLHGASGIYTNALQLSHGGKSLQCNTPVLKDVDPRV